MSNICRTPADFYKDDSVLGYAANAGTFKHIYKRKKSIAQEWELFPVKVTINSDGSRWTGSGCSGSCPNIYVFGDSFVFGSGVNDEQTFSYLFQAARLDKNVHLFALGGYGLSQAYLRFEQIKNGISSKDIIIIGYADFYDARNVAAPSRIRELVQWSTVRNPILNQVKKIPRVNIGQDGKLVFTLVAQNCEDSNCSASDPSQQYMTTVSARLINAIAGETKAKIYVLHFDGSKNNALFARLDPRIEIISALTDDFGYVMRDDIEGFDPHPGPYWHYAISRLLIDRVN